MQIKQIIAENGYITLHDFMEKANQEYYANNHVFGKEGDFITAPEITQIFGELIGLWLVSEINKFKDISSPLALVELGAGRGTLMADVLRIIRQFPTIYKTIEIHIIETSPSLIKIQKEALKSHNCHWHSDLQSLPDMRAIFIANEFFDALPIEQLIFNNEQWHQRTIMSKDGELEFTIGEVAPASLLGLIPSEMTNPKTNEIMEICPQGLKYMSQICEHIKAHGGLGLFIDYGYKTNAYGDSLQAVKNHKFTNPLENIGTSDLTAHVNFAELQKIATKNDVYASNIITQGEWLTNMGINFRAEQLIKNCKNINQQADIISACNRLTAPHLMGELFKVIAINTENDSFTAF